MSRCRGGGGAEVFVIKAHDNLKNRPIITARIRKLIG